MFPFHCHYHSVYFPVEVVCSSPKSQCDEIIVNLYSLLVLRNERMMMLIRRREGVRTAPHH